MRASKAILAATLTLAFTMMFSSVVQAYTVVSGHPRVDIRPSDLPTLAARATGSHSSTYNSLKNWCDSHINDSLSMGSTNLGYHMEAYAFVYLIEKRLGHPQYATYSNRVKALMGAMSGALGDSSHEPKRAFARGFDWIYPELTASEKSSFATKLSTMIDYTLPIEWRSGTHTMPRHTGPLVHLGLALYDDNPTKAIEALDKAHWWLIDKDNPYRHVDNWNEAAGDGAQYAGNYAYSNGTLWPAEWLHAWDKGTDGEDLADSFDHIKNLGTFYTYVSIPNFVDQPLGDGRLRFNMETGKGLYEASSIYNDALARWAANQCAKSWIDPNDWWYILWDDRTLTLPSLDDLPKSHFFNVLGAAYMRSGWNLTGSSTDIIANFRCSKRVDWHAHCDQGTFEIRRGPDYLAVDSGNPDCIKGLDPPGEHFADYYIRTVAHNSMLVFNPNEVFDMGSFHVRKNDGGQQWTNRDDSFPVGSRLPGGKNARGFIDKFLDRAEYTYSYGDATSAYSSTGNDRGSNTKISNFTRQFIYLKDRFFVVFDRVNSLDNPPSTVYEKRWLLHSINAPQIEDGGSWNGGATPNAYGGTPGTTSSNTNVLSVSRGNSKLFIDVLYPSNHVVRKIGGPSSSNTYNNANSYEFYHNGSNNYASDTPSQVDGRWRIEVSPTGADVKKANIFLHVLEPVDNAADATEAISLADETNGFYGVHIRHATEPWVVMCSAQEQLKETISYSISATGHVRHLICDLAPGSGQYNVYQNGQLLSGSPFPVTAANTLYFEADGGGTFAVAEGTPRVDETPPTGTVSINAGEERTNSNTVVLSLLATDGGSGMGTGAQMQFSNDGSSWSSPESYAISKSWTLVDVASGDEATRTVYVKFKDVAGNWSQPISDSIVLDKRPPQTPFGLSVQ